MTYSVIILWQIKFTVKRSEDSGDNTGSEDLHCGDMRTEETYSEVSVDTSDIYSDLRTEKVYRGVTWGQAR